MTPMPAQTAQSSKNTIVRANKSRRGSARSSRGSWQRALHGTVRPLVRGFSRMAPRTTVRLARTIFLRPPRLAPPSRESWWATEAREWSLPFGSGTLRAWTWGWGSETVLLVHGWGGRGLQLGAFAAPLVEAGYQVVAYDAPGHGSSVGDRSSLPEKAAAVTAMVHHLGGVEAIIAHSAGAAAVTAALAQPGTPLPVERLVYLAPSVDMLGVTERFASLLGLPMTVADRMREGIERQYGVRFAELAGVALAPRMAQPLLVVHDRDDREIAFAEGEALVGAWPGAEMLVTEGLGHFRLLRDDGVVARARRFLGEGGAESPKARSDQ